MEVNADTEEELIKFRKLYSIFLILTIFCLLEVFSGAYFKQIFNPEIEFGIVSFSILTITALLGIEKLGAALGGVIYYFSSIFWLPSFILFLIYRSKLKGIIKEINQEQLPSPMENSKVQTKLDKIVERPFLFLGLLVGAVLLLFGIFMGVYLRQIQTNLPERKLGEIEGKLKELSKDTYQTFQKSIICFQADLYMISQNITKNCLENFKKIKKNLNEVNILIDEFASLVENNEIKFNEKTNKEVLKLITAITEISRSNYYKRAMEAASDYWQTWIDFYEFIQYKDMDNLTDEEKVELYNLAKEIENSSENLLRKKEALNNYIYENFDEETISLIRKSIGIFYEEINK